MLAPVVEVEEAAGLSCDLEDLVPTAGFAVSLALDEEMEAFPGLKGSVFSIVAT